MFSSICAWTNGWVNNQNAGDLRRHHAHYDVTLIWPSLHVILNRFIFSTNWGRVTHICVSNVTIIDSDNGLAPGRGQAIIWTDARILLIRTWGTNFSEILRSQNSYIFIQENLLENVVCKMAYISSGPHCIRLDCICLTTTRVLRDTLAVLSVSMWWYSMFISTER